MSGIGNDYVEVKDRIVKFYEKYPEGRLTTASINVTSEPDGVPRVMVEAAAYRTADDPVPGRGWSWMVLPGSTNFTRGSELENTETSAWGRAMAAVGIEVKHSIASAQEVRNKQGQPEPQRTVRGEVAQQSDGPWEGAVSKGRAPVDHNLREAADGATFGFVVSEQIAGSQYPRKTQVLVHGDLAHALATVWATGVPESAMVWGTVEMVPWQKDGQDMRPFRRVHATRVMTPEWTLPATDAAAPVSVAPGASHNDLDTLEW